MFTLLRRLFWLAVLSGAGYAAYTAWQRKNEPAPDGPPAWPPLDDTTSTPPTQSDAAPVASSAPVPPTDTSADSAPVASAVPPTGDAPARDAWTTAAPGDRLWVEPVDGGCPPGYPIKGNDNSGIFHVPGGRFYERTVPERCYATEDDAVADGYRRAKA
jgi:hypothetical protein